MKKDYAKTEKQSNISIGMFGYQYKTSYHIYTSKQFFERHVDLSLVSNIKNSHYVLTKDFDIFVTN